MSNRVLVCLGAIEIKQNIKADRLIEMFKDLLDILHEKFAYSQGAVTLCTIPPLVELESSKVAPDQLEEQHKFNRWIRKIASCNEYKLIDFYKDFGDGDSQVYSSLFEP